MIKNQIENNIICGDCEKVLKIFDDNTFDLIMTSPPYANSRKRIYGGPSPDKYVDWFIPKAKEFLRVLKPRGTLIVNIKERVVNGERHVYVLDLIKEMKKQGWLWTEEYIWYKKNSYPGKWKNRFRDAWERCLQFNKEKNFNMYQDSVKIPIGDWAKKRFRFDKECDQKRKESEVGSGFGRKVSNWKNKRKVYPNNVLQLATQCSNRSHAATFPVSLPEWFIKLFTLPNSLVLDPFAGSGTTGIAAKNLNRRFVLIELKKDYYNLSMKYLKDYV
jgi:site-specific DNA-methyltransferase (cytosine-N4-specific)